MTNKLNVGILIFDGAEVLDFAGPFEVFSVTSELNNFSLFEVFTVAKSLSPINAVNGFSVNPKYAFRNSPSIDILIIPGGEGTRKLQTDNETLNWIKGVYEDSTFTLSICTGSTLLAVLKLLDHKPYCTHKSIYKEMERLAPSGMPQPKKRFVQSTDKIYTSAGISAGIDLSFHIVEKLHGKNCSAQTADYMEYNLD